MIRNERAHRPPRPNPPTTGSTRRLRADAREHRADYLADDGFTARVMAKLPAPRDAAGVAQARRDRDVGGGGVGIAVALPGAYTDVAREFFRVAVGHPVSLAQIATGVVMLRRSAAGRRWSGRCAAADDRAGRQRKTAARGRPLSFCAGDVSLVGELEVDLDLADVLLAFGAELPQP